MPADLYRIYETLTFDDDHGIQVGDCFLLTLSDGTQVARKVVLVDGNHVACVEAPWWEAAKQWWRHRMTQLQQWFMKKVLDKPGRTRHN